MFSLSWFLSLNNYIFSFPRPPPLEELSLFIIHLSKEVPLWTIILKLTGK